MVANWASSAAVNLVQHQVPVNTISTLALPTPLNDANNNSLRSKFDEKYAHVNVLVERLVKYVTSNSEKKNNADELVKIFFMVIFAFSFRSKLSFGIHNLLPRLIFHLSGFVENLSPFHAD